VIGKNDGAEKNVLLSIRRPWDEFPRGRLWNSRGELEKVTGGAGREALKSTDEYRRWRLYRVTALGFYAD